MINETIPQRMKAASFSIDQVMAKMEEALTSKP